MTVAEQGHGATIGRIRETGLDSLDPQDLPSFRGDGKRAAFEGRVLPNRTRYMRHVRASPRMPSCMVMRTLITAMFMSG